MTTAGRIETRLADYRDPLQAAAVVELLDSYARDPAGGGTPLPASVREGLPAAPAGFLLDLRKHLLRHALRSYEREGFVSYQLDPEFGHAVFLQKKL